MIQNEWDNRLKKLQGDISNLSTRLSHQMIHEKEKPTRKVLAIEKESDLPAWQHHRKLEPMTSPLEKEKTIIINKDNNMHSTIIEVVDNNQEEDVLVQENTTLRAELTAVIKRYMHVLSFLIFLLGKRRP